MRDKPAEITQDIKLFGSLLGLSEAECERMARGGSAAARKQCRWELMDRYFKANRPEPISRRHERKEGVEERELQGLEQLDFWQQSGRADRFVYFIQSGESGPVKLGLAKDPLRRMAELQTGNPEELSLRHVVPGKRTDEAKLHHRFREARIRGEWFGLSYLEIILIYGAGLASTHIKVFEESGALAVSPNKVEELPNLYSEKDQLAFRKEIERLWLKGFNAKEVAEFIWELSEEEVKAELKEMRKDPYWTVGRGDGRSAMNLRPVRGAA